MRSLSGQSFRRIVACFLLVLLPLQAIAATVIQPCPMTEMTTAAQSMQTMGCCPHEQTSHAMPTDNNAHHAPSGHEQSCALGALCLLVAPLAVLSLSPDLPALAAHTPQYPALSIRYISFVPEGIQRPPRIFS